MSDLPTTTELNNVRSDLEEFLAPDKGISNYTKEALAYVKRSLEDIRDIPWSQVYDSTNAVYFDNTDSTGRNRDRLVNAICNMTAALVFKDYAVSAAEGSKYWELYLAYRADCDLIIKTAKLDLDLDESGDITDDEEKVVAQSFMVK